MAAFSTYLSNKLLDHARGVAAYTMPTVYAALVTSASNANTPGTEAAYTGYTRVPTAGLFGSASAASGTNSGVITFPQCTAGSSSVVGVVLFDALTGGNMLEYGACSLAVSTGIRPQFDVGTFTTTLA
jgi:hypothetical protein